MKFFFSIILALQTLVSLADDRVEWLTPVSDNMVLRKESTPGEPACPLLAFKINAGRIKKVTVTLGEVELPVSQAAAAGSYQVSQWGKPPPVVPGNLTLKVDFKAAPGLEVRLTNVCVGKVFLFGDKRNRGGLASVRDAKQARADLRIRFVTGSDWRVASHEWIDPNLNPLPVSPDAKVTISRLLETGDTIGLVLFEPEGSNLSSVGGMRREPADKVTGSVWFQLARKRSLEEFQNARAEWVDLVAREQRQGRAVAGREWIRPEPIYVIVEGNLPQYRIDAAFW